MAVASTVSIRYIAVLGSQRQQLSKIKAAAPTSFHPLYRGTWFPTLSPPFCLEVCVSVSIRYIAVLGSQQVDTTNPDDIERHVSIRYIAVLGSQHSVSYPQAYFWRLVSIRYIAVLGSQPAKTSLFPRR